MRITSGGKIRHYVNFIKRFLKDNQQASITLVACGSEMGKAITVLEIVRRTLNDDDMSEVPLDFEQTTTISRRNPENLSPSSEFILPFLLERPTRGLPEIRLILNSRQGAKAEESQS